MSNVRKPKRFRYSAECLSEDYGDHGGDAFCVDIMDTFYTAKDVRALIKWLQKAEKWIANKEQYKPRGRKPKQKIACPLVHGTMGKDEY